MRHAVAIRRVVHELFDAQAPFVANGTQLRHYGDLLEPFGVPFDATMLQRGARTGYHAMCDAVLERLGTTSDLDIVVLAHATPDYDPTRSAASHVAFTCAREPRSFAISDHGIGAPFAALRVIAAHLGTPGFDAAALVVLEQTCLPNYDERVHSLHVDDSAVAISIAGTGGDRIGDVTRLERVAPADAPRRALERLRGEPEHTLLLAGPGLALDDEPMSVHRASGRHHCSAVWVELSRNLKLWRRRHSHVLVADYDRRLRQLHTARIAMGSGQ